MVERIHRRADFDALARARRRGRSGPVAIRFVPGPGPAAVAYAVSRAVGSAVVCNRVRRRLRAAVHAADRDGLLASGRYLVTVRPAAATLPYAALDEHLRRALGNSS